MLPPEPQAQAPRRSWEIGYEEQLLSAKPLSAKPPRLAQLMQPQVLLLALWQMLLLKQQHVLLLKQ